MVGCLTAGSDLAGWSGSELHPEALKSRLQKSITDEVYGYFGTF